MKKTDKVRYTADVQQNEKENQNKRYLTNKKTRKFYVNK